MYLWVQGLILVLSGCVGFIPPLFNPFLHLLQLTGMWCGSALKALKKKKKKGILSDFPLSTTLFFFFSFCADGSGLLCLVFTHSTLCSSLIILIHLSLCLLLELDDRHSVQVAVCPATIYTVLQQVLCR